jgi:hypothetical protein
MLLCPTELEAMTSHADLGNEHVLKDKHVSR